MEYRTEFLLNIAIGAIWQMSVIVFATVLLARFTGMGGWDSSDVLLIPAIRMLAHGLFVLLLGRVHFIGRQVQEGGSTSISSARCRCTARSSWPTSRPTRSAT